MADQGSENERGGVLGAGVFCCGCAYALNGLARGGACPECGVACRWSVVENSVFRQGPGFLWKIRVGAWMAVYAQLVYVVGLLGAVGYAFMRPPTVGGALLALDWVVIGVLQLFALLWLAGWFLATTPSMEERYDRTISPARRWVRLFAVLLVLSQLIVLAPIGGRWRFATVAVVLGAALSLMILASISYTRLIGLRVPIASIVKWSGALRDLGRVSFGVLALGVFGIQAGVLLNVVYPATIFVVWIWMPIVSLIVLAGVAMVLLVWLLATVRLARMGNRLRELSHSIWGGGAADA